MYPYPHASQPLKLKRFQARKVVSFHQDFGLPAAALSRRQRQDGSPRGVEKDGVTSLLLLKMGFSWDLMGFSWDFHGI